MLSLDPLSRKVFPTPPPHAELADPLYALDQVRIVLGTASRGVRIGEVAAAAGLSVAAARALLNALERRGEAQLHGGVWTPG